MLTAQTLQPAPHQFYLSLYPLTNSIYRQICLTKSKAQEGELTITELHHYYTTMRRTIILGITTLMVAGFIRLSYGDADADALAGVNALINDPNLDQKYKV